MFNDEGVLTWDVYPAALDSFGGVFQIIFSFPGTLSTSPRNRFCDTIRCRPASLACYSGLFLLFFPSPMPFAYALSRGKGNH